MCVYIYIRELEKLAAIDAKAAIVKLELAVVYYRLGEFAHVSFFFKRNHATTLTRLNHGKHAGLPH